MNPATKAALLLLAAGWLQSFVYVCSKLPPERLPAGFPQKGSGQVMLNLAWMIMFVFGISSALKVSTWLALIGGAIYFTALPFAFQLPLVKLFGYKNFRQFTEEIDRAKSERFNLEN